MPRLVLVGVSSLLLLGFCAYSVVTTWLFPRDVPIKGPCQTWLERPVARWLALEGCLLDVEMLVLESDEGDFERLSNRKAGLSSRPYSAPPRWVAAWIPIRAGWMNSGLVRAVYRLESDAAMRWLNALERVDDREKERMWADPAPIRRLSRPGVLPGKAEKPGAEALRQAFGTAASGNLMAVIAGDPPPPRAPTQGLIAGVLGLLLLGYFVHAAGRASPLAEPPR